MGNCVKVWEKTGNGIVAVGFVVVADVGVVCC